MNNQERNPQGDVAVVTGACGGLGAALSRALVKEGVQVVGIARTISKVDALADELGALFTPVVADVGDATAIAQAFETIAADIGPVTILINNAAVYPRCDILAETPQSFMRSVEINLGGVFNCCHAVLPGMVERGAGRIINVSTYAHIAPLQAAAAYSVSKGAAHVFTKSLVADLSDRFPNIVINEWIPGELRTEMGVPEVLIPRSRQAGACVWHCGRILC